MFGVIPEVPFLENAIFSLTSYARCLLVVTKISGIGTDRQIINYNKMKFAIEKKFDPVDY